MAKFITVKELKEIIKDLPDDAIVLGSSDEEGNTISPIFDYHIGVIGKRIIQRDTNGAFITEYDDGDDFLKVPSSEKGKQYIVLYPII